MATTECQCYGCKPNNIPDEYTGETCSICFCPLGSYPAVPSVGSMCVTCCDIYDKTCHHTPKLDPYTRLPLKTCKKGHIVHNYNYLSHLKCMLIY